MEEITPVFTFQEGPDVVFLAAEIGNAEHLRLAIENRSQVAPNWSSTTSLQIAASKGHVECVRIMAKMPRRFDLNGVSGNSALCGAATEGHLECMRILIEATPTNGIRRKKF